MLSMVHSQINRAINTAISERVIPEIQNIVSLMSSSGNRDTEASMSPCSQENRESSSGLKSKITKDSRSVGDLGDTAPSGHYSRTTYVPSLFPDLSMKHSNFPKTVHTIFTKFCTVILHPKGPLRVQRHQNRMAGM